MSFDVRETCIRGRIAAEQASAKAHDGEYRRALKDWESFVKTTTQRIIEIDSTVPELPIKDVSYRIYRDLRFTEDPTPYKVRRPTIRGGEVYYEQQLTSLSSARLSLISLPPGPAQAATATTQATTSAASPARRPSEAACGTLIIC